MNIKQNYKSGSLRGGSLEATKGPKGGPRNTSDRQVATVEQWQQSEKLTDIFCFICDLNEYVYLTASRFFVFVTVSEVKSEQ